MKRMILAALLLIAIPVAAQAQQRRALLAYKYDQGDTTTMTFCRMNGENGSPFGSGIAGPGAVETSGSSTTVTESVAGSNPFTNVAVGDLLILTTQTGTVYERVVRTRTDATEVVVDTALNLSDPTRFRYYTLSCGTAVTDGWVSVGGAERITFAVQYNAGDLTGGLDYLIECKSSGPGAAPIQVYPDSGNENLASPGAKVGDFVIGSPDITVAACRVGVAAGTSDADGTLEEVTISVLMR